MRGISRPRSGLSSIGGYPKKWSIELSFNNHPWILIMQVNAFYELIPGDLMVRNSSVESLYWRDDDGKRRLEVLTNQEQFHFSGDAAQRIWNHFKNLKQEDSSQ
jgi:hypothetical protein